MPLIVNGSEVTTDINDVSTFLNQHPGLEKSSRDFLQQERKVTDSKGLLYIGQREYGGTVPGDDVISVLGTEDATTCHIGVIRDTESGATCLAHFDGCNTAQGLRSMLDLLRRLGGGKYHGHLCMHLIGGFDDDRNLSRKLSVEVLNIVKTLDEEIHLETACVTEINTTKRNGVPFPVIYGAGVNIKTGCVFKSSFPEKGPDLPLRGARHFTGSHNMINIYDHVTKMLKLDPFSYGTMSDVSLWCEVPDEFIRENLSTSPAQEPPGFVGSVRASLQQIRDHPEPLKTMFTGGKPRCYKKNDDGTWTKFDS